MKSFEELEARRLAAPIGPRGQGVVRAICLRRGGGRHESVQRAAVTCEGGVVGDRWSRSDDPERLCQVTFMNASVGEWIAHGDTPARDAGDNFLVDLDLSEGALPVGAQVRVGKALLEVTAEPHLGCKKFRERFGASAMRWVNHQDLRAQRLRGVNLRVLDDGEVAVGDAVVVLLPQ
jgi:MOSC domain-containing protein YiiM